MKKIIILVLIFGIAFAFTGCGKKDSQTTKKVKKLELSEDDSGSDMESENDQSYGAESESSKVEHSDIDADVSAEDLKINVNTVGVEELTSVKGIGPSTAENIIKYRDENGPFKSLDDLTNVSRIGPKTVAKLKPFLTVGKVEKTSSETAATEQPEAANTSSAQSTAPAISADGKVNINSASASQLTSIKGIGPSTAGNIIKYREEHGPFKTVDDLVNVKRIGPKTVEKLRPFVTAGAAGESSASNTTTASPAAASTSTSEPEKSTTPTPTASGSKVNINTATASQLTSVKGIGPSTANNIIKYREEHGPFKTVDDIVNVKRIGPKTLEKLRPFITVE